MRLFTAVDPSDDVRRNLERLLAQLRPAARLRWSSVANLHLTLKFIGEWPETDLPRLRETLAAIPGSAPFDVRVTGLGFFPHARAPRVFWAGLQAPPDLARLAGTIDAALVPLGVVAETRPYSPHLTLARVREGDRTDGLVKTLQSLTDTDCGAFTADRFYLYESRPSSGGSVYTRIGEYPFGR
jgi:2'-5' RNA ligase